MPDCKSSRATLQRASEASFTKQAMSCGHLKQAKNYKELLKSFSAIARYSLLYRNKQSLRINKKGKELRALLKVDNPEGEMNNSSSSQQQQVVSTAQQKKKALQASGMERVVASVEKLPTPKCTDCNDIMASARLHCCLECIHIGCYGTHMNKHYESTKHQFYMDFVHCNVYCCECRDYVYSADFDARIEKEEFHLHYISTRIREPFSAHAYHSTWIPTTNEKQLISLKYTPSKCTGKFIYFAIMNEIQISNYF